MVKYLHEMYPEWSVVTMRDGETKEVIMEQIWLKDSLGNVFKLEWRPVKGGVYKVKLENNEFETKTLPGAINLIVSFIDEHNLKPTPYEELGFLSV